MHIDQLLQTVQAVTDGEFVAEVSEDWAQGRTLFGGLQAMLALRAMRLAAPDAPPLWSLQTTFVAPAPVGKVKIKTQLLRQGRAAMQMEARLMQGENTAATVVAVFGAARESSIRVEAPTARPITQDGAPELPFLPGIMPSFTQHYAYKIVEGGLPFSGSKLPYTRIALRQRDEGLLEEAHIVALADSIPPPALSMLAQPMPASTLSWSLEFVRHLPPTSSAEWWRMEADIVAARDGYSNQDAHLYGPDGQLVALSRQVVAVFG